MKLTIPEELLKPIIDLANYAESLFQRHDFEEAGRIHKDRYEILSAVESLTGQRFQKGDPLQMQGLCTLPGNTDEAFSYFAASHVENVISDGPAAARSYGAYYVISRGYQVDAQDLEAFSSFAVERAAERNPFAIISAYEKSIGKPLISFAKARLGPLAWKKMTLGQIPSDPSKCVFLGGSYGNILWLQRIEQAIIELDDYLPVLEINFDKPVFMNNYEFAKTLLSKCGYAVFEISEIGRGGHLLELAGAKDQKIKCIGVYQSQGSTERPKDSFGGMIDWLEKIPYSSLDDLKSRLNGFLSS
jgi:hypothetical protein